MFKYLGSAFIILAILLSSCKDEPTVLEPPYRYDVPVLLATNVLKYESREIQYYLDLAVFKGDNETASLVELDSLPDSSFHFLDYEFNGTWARYKVDTVEYRDSIPFNTFTTLILIDQSASPENFDSTDFYNYRFQAFNAFYRNLEGQGKVMFATYNRDNNEHDVIEPVNSEFRDSWDAETAKSLLNLTHKQSGTAALFDALNQAIDLMSIKYGENKSICLFVRNRDDGKSLLSLDSIVAKAQLKGIKINVVWLIHDSQNTDLKALRKLSSKTGGFSVYMGKIYQSSTVFMALPALLCLRTHFYRIKVTLTIEAPNFFNPVYSDGMYLYYYPPTYFIWSYIPYLLEKN